METDNATLDEARPHGWRRLLHQPDRLADFTVRGFASDPPELRARLETAAGTFLAGFNQGLAAPAGAPPRFDDQPEHLRGFAVEGLAMQAALLDLLVPGNRRLPAVLRLHGATHIHLIHVGVGWAMAKLRWPFWARLSGLDPLLRWLALDGWGFSAGFFADADGLRRITAHPRRCSERCAIRYQGVGRSLWFRGTGEPTRVANLVDTLPQWHHGDAWSGVGLAAAYAGGVSPDGLTTLRDRAGAHAGDLGQGVAFAAAAWQRGGWTPPELATTVHALTDVDPRTAADWTREAEAGLRTPATGPAEYQTWRQRIRARVLLASL
ncbi:DUF1702 family protein [Micromonospora sp. NPDC005220]|uniref:DUF1702 family protein n=1 Tax=Micromonospora sp. NPDC005220 TaxID=3155589 RepID=UPI0033A80CDE